MSFLLVGPLLLQILFYMTYKAYMGCDYSRGPVFSKNCSIFELLVSYVEVGIVELVGIGADGVVVINANVRGWGGRGKERTEVGYGGERKLRTAVVL